MATEIKYNGSTIASIFPGQTATLKCEGMKMESDLVVEAGEGQGSCKLGSLSVIENGTYESFYESETVTWDENTEYDGVITVDGIPLRYKKVASLSVPDDVAVLNSPVYSIKMTKADGTALTMPLSELSIVLAAGAIIANDMVFTVVWVQDATYINSGYGASLEDNTVYVTDYLWLAEGEEMDGATLTLTAPGKKLDGVSSVTVDVEAEPNLQFKFITENGEVTPDEGYDGLSKVTVAVESSGGGAVIACTTKRLNITNAVVTANDTILTIGA